MTLKIFELVSIVLLTLVSGMYWGPWLALSRSMASFKPEVFIAIVHRISKNMRSLMIVLMPVALLSAVPVLVISYGAQQIVFYLTLVALILFIISVLVTVFVEVPIVKQIETWTPTSLPENWQELRDRWSAFHIARMVPSFVGLILLLVAVIFYLR